MGADENAGAPTTLVKDWPLVGALNQSEEIKTKVVECAQELSSITEVLKHDGIEHLPTIQVEQALHQSRSVEVKVQECADDLSLVNEALAKEIMERKALERELVDGKTELADTQAVLSDTQQQELRSRHLALHDPVTGLPNRSSVFDRLETAIAQAQQHSWRIAVMFIDLDKFKTINDRHGHDAGDKVLQIVSERLRGSVRDVDTVGRQGGDEFVYLMLEAKDRGDVETAAGRIVEIVGQPCEFDGLTLIVQPSIGIALYPQDGKSASLLLKNADSAMYSAKQNGRGYSFYAH